MATVNFQCGNCNNLMAVAAENVGEQVRCPHCQAVVVAPAAPPPPAPAPAPAPASVGPAETLSFAPPQLGDHEDIFSPAPPSDDLFGEPDGPRLEMPPPPPPAAPPDGPVPAAPSPPVSDLFGPTLSFPGPPSAVPAGDATLPSWIDHPAAPEPAPSPSDLADHAPAAGQEHAETLSASVRRPRDRGGWFVGLIFIPLLSYSVLVTILAVYLFMVNQQNQQQAAPPNPLENLPSFDPNDAEHTTHLKLDPNKLNRVSGIDLARATAPLPGDRITGLGKPLRVGDLEILPEAVSRQVVSVDVKGYAKPEPCRYPSLVLRLKLRNVSDNVVFQPMDAYFDRHWDRQKGGQPPLTILELPGGAETLRLFGGPAHFPPPTRKAEEGDNPRESVHGGHADRVLKPGEEMEGLVCTDGNDKEAADAIDACRGRLLWRVHLRNGVVVLNEHRYVPVSSVVGVEFSDEDYRKSS